MKNIDHKRIFLYALRTAILATIGFFIYELLTNLEKKDKQQKKESFYTIHRRQLIKFTIIFIIDLFILYFFAKVLDVDV